MELIFSMERMMRTYERVTSNRGRTDTVIAMENPKKVWKSALKSKHHCQVVTKAVVNCGGVSVG